MLSFHTYYESGGPVCHGHGVYDYVSPKRHFVISIFGLTIDFWVYA